MQSEIKPLQSFHDSEFSQKLQRMVDQEKIRRDNREYIYEEEPLLASENHDAPELIIEENDLLEVNKKQKQFIFEKMKQAKKKTNQEDTKSMKKDSTSE